MGGAHEMHARVRRFAGYGCGAPASETRLAISGHGELERDMRPSINNTPDMTRMRAPCLVGPDPHIDRNAGRAQPRVTAPSNLGIGVFQRRDDTRDAGLDNGIRAGRRLAMMRARLECHVERAPPSRRTRARQCFGFGMRASPGAGDAAADDNRRITLIAHDNRAHRWVGPGLAEATPAERKRERHEPRVVIHGVGFSMSRKSGYRFSRLREALARPSLWLRASAGVRRPKKDMLKRSGDIADPRKSGCCLQARSAKVR